MILLLHKEYRKTRQGIFWQQFAQRVGCKRAIPQA